MWCDTNFTPCQMKSYDGSAWVAFVDASVPIQDNFSSFPSTPSDGQIFVTRNPPELCYYDATNTKWYCFAAPGSQQGANVSDSFTGSTITAPGSALTLADNATAGNATAGAKSCKVTFANSTGGETTMSAASNTVTFTASHSFDWTSIPTGGTGTTQRRIYCTKAGAAATGPWYWIYTVNDNTTTSVTANAGLADANLLRYGPQSNYSAALDARWTIVNHTAGTTSGGCGSTGSAMACSSGTSASPDVGAGITTDPSIRAILDLTSYNTGDYTIQYRIKLLDLTATQSTSQGPCVGTARAGSADNAIAYTLCTANNGTAGWATPISSTNPPFTTYHARTAIAGSHRGFVQSLLAWPRLTATTWWVRWVKKGNFANFFTSVNARDWSPVKSTGNTTTESSLSQDVSGTANPTEFEIELLGSNAGETRYYIEIDSFTLTVN